MIGDLPVEWTSVKLSSVCNINPRSKSGLGPDDEVSFVPMAAVSEFSGTIVGAEKRLLRDVQKGFTPFQEGDVLFAKITPCMENGKAAIARGLVNQRGYGSTEFHVIRPSSLVLAEWIFAIIRTPEFRRAAAASFQGAVGQQRVTASFLESFRIPLPPLSEQRRIIEILQEAEKVRQLRDLAKIKTAELIPAVFDDHFTRAGTIEYQPLYKIADVVSGVAIGRKTRGLTFEVPYLRVANVQAGYIDLSEVKSTSANEQEILQFSLKSGDILLTEGGDFDKLGRGCLWEGQVDPCIHQNHVFRVRPLREYLNPHFFAHYLQSANAKQYFLRCAKKTTNLASINLTQLKALPVPAIEIKDQEHFEKQIVEANKFTSSFGTQTFKALVASLRAKAFSGELTAEWRDAHKQMLVSEAQKRDAALPQSGIAPARFSRATPRQENDLWADRADGIYSELNREQRELLVSIRKSVGRLPYIEYFTAQSLMRFLETGQNEHAIEGHLAVLSARGLIIPISREEQATATGEYIFGHAYRLPRADSLSPEDGESLPGDRARTREMERLAARIAKERVST